MAAGFKTATVNASDVPSTQTDFPSYINLSRLGITTLAEAQSVRVYADSGKTTEWAREIVSETEMWVKVPSLTSTTTTYVDWDGSRSDYATTATYGARNVWTGLDIVSHYEADGLNSVDDVIASAPNANTQFNATGKMGDAMTQTDSTNMGVRYGAAYSHNGSNITHSAWFKSSANITQSNSDMYITKYLKTGTPYNGFGINMTMGSVTGDRGKLAIWYRDSSGSGGLTSKTTTQYNDGNWHHAVATFDGTTLRLYVDGVEVMTQADAGVPGTNLNFDVGTNWNFGEQSVWVGQIDEVRVDVDATKTANWITTEYNNQNDEATFWGTWTDAGGGGGGNTTDFFIMT